MKLVELEISTCETVCNDLGNLVISHADTLQRLDLTAVTISLKAAGPGAIHTPSWIFLKRNAVFFATESTNAVPVAGPFCHCGTFIPGKIARMAQERGIFPFTVCFLPTGFRAVPLPRVALCSNTALGATKPNRFSHVIAPSICR